jgi:(5-formylfuran-3-yl)methyl phosphate synthase
LAQLLVSVKSAQEARTALEGGASIIDVKEPDHGSLGMARWSVWREVHTAVGTAAPISVALGELPDWLDTDCPMPPTSAWTGISYRKLGLAGSGVDWPNDWRSVRFRLGDDRGPAWIAVVYADWEAARAPHPNSILELAIQTDCVGGVLVDTRDKTRPADFTERWVSLSQRVRQAGKLLALAGGVDRQSIASLGRLAPDIVAVRGAACVDGNRRLTIELARVADLARSVGQLG